ncbi:hypothetical protein GN958_ATG14886 [Phytophthora infestans]|uniref:Uncharacterized protein n=1 Tax=Phytophthora infestans TaxID=4787 RepID=A0A8S9U5Q9_PHYIN|nr:hypothetical protein GN958_ATG14886 [Phytophthora infestans]
MTPLLCRMASAIGSFHFRHAVTRSLVALRLVAVAFNPLTAHVTHPKWWGWQFPTWILEVSTKIVGFGKLVMTRIADVLQAIRH